MCLLAVLSGAFLLNGEAFSQVRSIREKQEKGKPLPDKTRNEYRPPILPFRAAPPGPVHSCAEWEESEGVMTLWWNHDLIDKLQADTKVYIPVDNQTEKDSWISYLNSNGIPLTNIEFWFIITNSIYTRDYGPWFIWDANNDMGVVNYTCNYGYWDDLFPSAFCSKFRINYYESGLEHVGGNWYPNAYNTAFSTTMVYWSNWQMTTDEVNQVMSDCYGTEQYNTAAVAPWTIEHHDCWGKPSNPETILICEYPEYSEYYPYGEAMNDHYETLESPWGRPYRIIRMPMFKMSGGWFEFRPYLNALVSNKKVYMAVCNHPDDQEAIAVFQEAFPGYEIVGVDHMGTGFNDALHCRTRNFVKRDAIRIYPMPPGDTEETAADYTVTAEVIPPKGNALVTGYPAVHWTATGGQPYNDVVMTPTGQPNEYECSIPAQPMDTTVSFYMEAVDDGAHSAIYPLVAPDGLMSFNVREDVEPPVLSRFIPTRSVAAGQWPPVIRALCKDDMYTPEVWVEWSINGAPQQDIVLDREHMCYWYSGGLSQSSSPGDIVKYRVKAADNSAAQHTDVLPVFGEVCCPVFGPGESVAVVEMSTRPYTGPFLAETFGALDIPYTYYTEWPSDWDEHDRWFISLGTTPDNHVLNRDEAIDITSALQDGDFIYLESSDTWCWDPEKNTLAPWFKIQQISNGGNCYGAIQGQPGSLMSGLSLTFAGESAYNDEIGALTGADLIFKSYNDNKGRSVLYSEPGGYKTIASSFALGGFLDGDWPQTRKNVLFRIFDFFDMGSMELYAKARAELGATVTVRLEGSQGDEYLMVGSFAENYLPSPYGVCRVAFSHLFILGQGVFPVSDQVEFDLLIPRDEAFLGLEVHLQALVGEKIVPPKNAHFTNREILTIM